MHPQSIRLLLPNFTVFFVLPGFFRFLEGLRTSIWSSLNRILVQASAWHRSFIFELLLHPKNFGQGYFFKLQWPLHILFLNVGLSGIYWQPNWTIRTQSALVLHSSLAMLLLSRTVSVPSCKAAFESDHILDDTKYVPYLKTSKDFLRCFLQEIKCYSWPCSLSSS